MTIVRYTCTIRVFRRRMGTCVYVHYKCMIMFFVYLRLNEEDVLNQSLFESFQSLRSKFKLESLHKACEIS